MEKIASFSHDDWNHNKRYGAGSWAPSLRFHDDKYWMFVGSPASWFA